MQRRPLHPHKGDQNREQNTEDEKEYYQYGGAMGALFTSVCFIGLTYIVVEKIQSGKWEMLRVPEFPSHVGGWLDFRAAAMFLGWLGAQCILYLLPIGGPIELGSPTKDNGRRLSYRLNGFFVFMVNTICLLAATYAGVPVTMLTSKALQLLTAGLVTFFLLSIVLYAKGMTLRPRDRSPCGQTKSAYYNWFIGVELHPRFGFLDLKLVLFRSVVIGWMIFNWVNVMDAYETGHLTPSLILVSSLQLVYVLDTFWFETGMLVSREIIHEALGFNHLSLCLMIPFTFCVQTRYLVTTGFTLPWYCLVPILVLNLTGYWILRGSNSEKNNFRRNPKDPAFAKYETLPTRVKGKNLLVSGWWGMSRHPNYFGDILINFTFALPTGFGHFLPYLNPVLLVLLLIDRERMDGEDCRQRYGDVWDKYCEKVKYRIIPYVY
ncbi:delta(14)-sterol reductase LBR-like [Pecten maximus]|uniref:delta(14)-sterol reductase LBR-like n=1 Tax=Pecten maximus TaxID=6579 RepID=UPI001458F510|nr:delta(14)-sterol reductase LBR-like [Pecten maximus]XP_033732299.1 delta(14)-sterol reductase LBR-like [Pecten maximus]